MGMKTIFAKAYLTIRSESVTLSDEEGIKLLEAEQYLNDHVARILSKKGIGFRIHLQPIEDHEIKPMKKDLYRKGLSNG